MEEKRVVMDRRDIIERRIDTDETYGGPERRKFIRRLRDSRRGA